MREGELLPATEGKQMTKTTVLKNPETETVSEQILRIHADKKLPDSEYLTNLLLRTNRTLLSEPELMRPGNSAGFPGGVVYLKRDIQTILVPDLHSRIDFLLNILFQTDGTGFSTLQKMGMGLIQMVCVGDGIHSENRGRRRWLKALEEYKTGFEKHRAMDREMSESLRLMLIVMHLKNSFPEHFHFLKGNHENITNEAKQGNHPFAKFAFEGPMVLFYMKKFYGEQLLFPYYQFEKRMPLLAVGRNFLCSHAEPRSFYNTQKLINYRLHPEVIDGLTWTDNGEAEEDSAARMLNHYLAPWETKNALYFTGHRAVGGRYKLRAEGKLVQFHNPGKFIIARINPTVPPDPERDVVELANRTEEIRRSNR